MGDWEDFCNSNGKGMDWEPWDEPGWGDDVKEDSYDSFSDYQEHGIDKKELNKSIIILTNLLERVCANKKDFTKMEMSAIKHAISVLSEQDGYENESACGPENATLGWGHPQNNAPKQGKEPPMDFDDDIPF